MPLVYRFYFVDFDSKIGKKASLPLGYSLIVSAKQYRNYKEPYRRSSFLQVTIKYLFFKRINKDVPEVLNVQMNEMQKKFFFVFFHFSDAV